MRSRGMRRDAALCIAAAALAGGLLADAAEAKKKPLGRYWGGTTEQGAPFTLQLARGGKAAVGANFQIYSTCADQQRFGIFGRLRFAARPPQFVADGDHVVAPAKLRRTGRFDASGVGSVGLSGGGSAVMTERLAGRVRRDGSASGTYIAGIAVVDAGGNQLTTCDTGPIKWQAKSRKGVVYVGTTSAGPPVVLTLTAPRNAVQELDIGWAAMCTNGGAVLIPDSLTDFRITNGSFGDTFQQVFPLDGGGSMTFDYDLAGVVASRTRSTGNLSVKMTETDAAGAVQAVCDAGRSSWTVRSG